MRRPSPAIAIALVALFVALGGTTMAASRSASRSPGKAKVTAYANRIVLYEEAPETELLTIPNVVDLDIYVCRRIHEYMGVSVVNLAPGDASELTEPGGGYKELGWIKAGFGESTGRFRVSTGSGTTTTIADIEIHTAPVGEHECSFTVTAQVYKG
jgi:hypothetical protein